MKIIRAGQMMAHRLLYRSLMLPAILTTVLLLIALTLLVGMSWRSLERIGPVHDHLEELGRLQQASLTLQQMLQENLSRRAPVDPQQLARLRHELDVLIHLNTHLVSTTPQELEQARTALTARNTSPRSALLNTQSALRQVLSGELHAHDVLLQHLSRNTQVELEIAVILLIGFPVLIGLTLFFLRNRILMPLDNLGTLMSMLARQDYASTQPRKVDPLLRPLFENYNGLVSRLFELEARHQQRQYSLEQEVRIATQALLEQQRTLARAERLAAVGELAAGLAHELRNPLAGVQMALSNLRHDIQDPDQAERLELVSAEVKRLTRLLNDQLSSSRQTPEPSTELGLAQTVEQLLALLRYQITPAIRLEHDIAESLSCKLPAGQLRQAVLNMVLNAAQAIGEQEGLVTVKAHIQDQTLTLSVHDDGPGFPDELLNTGIRAFASWRDNGTGLGLSIVRRFVHDLGGELKLANHTPHGASVTLIIPCKDNHG